MNKVKLLNDEWYFAKTRLNKEIPSREAFMLVDLPHDWLIEDSENLYENSIGWYRRSVHIEETNKQ